LDKAIKRRDSLKEEVQRIKGRLEAARKDLAEVEEECRSKGLDPNDLDAAIGRLEKRYEEEVTALEARIEEAEEAMTPYLGES